MDQKVLQYHTQCLKTKVCYTYCNIQKGIATAIDAILQH